MYLTINTSFYLIVKNNFDIHHKNLQRLKNKEAGMYPHFTVENIQALILSLLEYSYHANSIPINP